MKTFNNNSRCRVIKTRQYLVLHRYGYFTYVSNIVCDDRIINIFRAILGVFCIHRVLVGLDLLLFLWIFVFPLAFEF